MADIFQIYLYVNSELLKIVVLKNNKHSLFRCFS